MRRACPRLSSPTPPVAPCPALLLAPLLVLLLTDAARGQEVSGRVMYDFLESGKSDFGDRSHWRRQRVLADWERGRLRVRGQAEFSGDARLLELYGDLSELPFGSLRFGHFREPQGLEALTSSAYIDFLERAAPIEAFTPGRNDGVRFDGRAGDWAWAAGAFKDADDVDGPRGDGLAVTARLVRTFGDDSATGSLVHTGLSASVRDPRGDSVRLRARVGTALVPAQADTGDLDADGLQVMGLEAAWRQGPLSLQSEAFVTRVDLEDAGTAYLGGAYMQAAFTLTGEARGYSRSRSAFTGIDPDNPFTSGGRGAWELAARLSRTDLEDGDVRGDRQDTLTLGLNVYLTEHARVMFDWVHFDLDEADDDGELFLLRLQLGI